MRVALWWRGDFIDAARHWRGRGQGFQPPAGEDIVNGTPGVPFAVLPASDSAWPAEFERADNARQPDKGYVFKGYKLAGEQRIPTFLYMFDEVAITDTPAPHGDADTADGGFERRFEFRGKIPAGLHFRAALADSIEQDGETFLIDDSLSMRFAGARPVIRAAGGKQELLVPVPGAELVQIITWQ